jgi:hypothetical protein
MAEIKIVHEAGNYVVHELFTQACSPCNTGWHNGTLASPKNGGKRCTHGGGQWQAGQVGPRGGWYGIGPQYGSKRAAVLVCDALAEAAAMPRQGV